MDKQKAYHYFQAAAGQDLAEAQVNLGKLHLGKSGALFLHFADSVQSEASLALPRSTSKPLYRTAPRSRPFISSRLSTPTPLDYLHYAVAVRACAA